MMALTPACLVTQDGPSGMGPSVARALWLLMSSDWVRDRNIFQAEPIRIFYGSFLRTTFSVHLSSGVPELGCQGSWAAHQKENQDISIEVLDLEISR